MRMKWRSRYTPREVEKNKDLIGDVLADADRHFARLFRRKCLELRTSARPLLVGTTKNPIPVRPELVEGSIGPY